MSTTEDPPYDPELEGIILDWIQAACKTQPAVMREILKVPLKLDTWFNSYSYNKNCGCLIGSFALITNKIQRIEGSGREPDYTAIQDLVGDGDPHEVGLRVAEYYGYNLEDSFAEDEGHERAVDWIKAEIRKALGIV